MQQSGKPGAASCEFKDLREQMRDEIENKSKTCSNPTYECSIPRLDGYEYCLRHILRDPHNNYRQCTYTYQNARKCPNAVLKHDTKKDPALTTLCFEHSRQTQLLKTHSTVGKFRRADTNDALLHSLSHHLNIEQLPEKTATDEQDEEIDVVSPYVAPFVNYDQIHDLDTVTATMKKRRRILDYASDSSADEEPPTMENTAFGHECNESDVESVDSENEDQLKHAAVYAREEGIRISEAKLTKLQGLYIEQINNLHHILKERRRRYLQAIRKEREVLCSIHDQVKDTPRERALYEQLKALNTYHRRHGVEAVLYKKFKEKRTRSIEGWGQRGPGFPKCVYIQGGVKCGTRALPCCKYCLKHILEDKKQTLFRACQVERSGVVCQEPIPSIFDDSTCALHLKVPTKRNYIQKKCESETEDDALDNAGQIKIESLDTATQQTDNEININEEVKAEIQDSPQTMHANTANCNVTISHDIKMFVDCQPKIECVN